MDLPRVLAGPILRRVDPKAVAVWMAFSEATTVTLDVWEGERRVGDSAGESVASVTLPTRSISAKLHIALLYAIPKSPLKPATFYSYDLTLANSDDLNSLGFLIDAPGLKESRALGYQTDALPGFYTPPTDVSKLKIVHGSCRKPHGYGKDMLAVLDDYIESHRMEAENRPHYLFLTGDQIYADDVALPLLPMLTEAGVELLGLTEKIPTSPNATPLELTQDLFPAGRRGTLMSETAHFTSTEAGSHLIGFGEFCAMYLFAWSNAIWPLKLPDKDAVKEKALKLDLSTKDLLTPIHNDPPKEKQRFEKFQKDLEKEWDEQIERLKEFRNRLSHVRRVLANVPVFMIFDDHEVTDDWFITRAWRERTQTQASPLGSTIIRHAMTAYTLFQGWGNDPEAFKTGEHAQVLQSATDLIQGGTINKNAADTLDRLFGLTGVLSPLKWHYKITGGQYEIAVLDTRTRRTYPTRISPPGLLDAQALTEQVPEQPQSQASELLIVISPAPVLGLQVFEEMVQPVAAGIIDAIHVLQTHMKDHSTTNEKLRARLDGAMSTDMETWAFNPEAIEALFARLQPHGSVLILSGDVHYGFTSLLDYWKEGQPKPTRIVQAVASAFQNENPPPLQFLMNTARVQQIFARGLVPAVRFGWKNPLLNLDPLILFPGTKLSFHQRARLRQSPLLVNKFGLPPGIQFGIQPEWRWRLDVVKDTRPDDDSPDARIEAVRVTPLEPDVNLNNALEGYVRAVKRYAEQQEKSNIRRIVWQANFGLIRFEREDNGGLVVNHDLYYELEDEAEPLTVVHRVPLTTPGDIKAPTV